MYRVVGPEWNTSAVIGWIVVKCGSWWTVETSSAIIRSHFNVSSTLVFWSDTCRSDDVHQPQLCPDEFVLRYDAFIQSNSVTSRCWYCVSVLCRVMATCSVWPLTSEHNVPVHQQHDVSLTVLLAFWHSFTRQEGKSEVYSNQMIIKKIASENCNREFICIYI